MSFSAYTKRNQEVKGALIGKDFAPGDCEVANKFAGWEAAH